MKMRLFSSFILSLCSVMAFSQTILYQAETSSRVVQDPQTVLLEQGFTATSDVSNPFVAQLGAATENPGGGPADSNAGANNPSGTITSSQDQKFHDTKGNIEVTGAGQLQFTLPIALPPGVKSVAPQINLTYTSGSTNGIAGYGWSIAGITAVSRISKNIEKNGVTKAIQLDYSDHYSFNGQRLILKSGEYGKDGAEYVTEKYSNVKIKSLGTKNGVPGPMLFHVTFEDGSQAWYGDTVYDDSEHYSAARTSLEYNIVKWMDAQGNYITYEYEKNLYLTAQPVGGGDVTKIKRIKWGGNETLNKPHFNEIIFNYNVDRTFKEISYHKGFYYNQDKLLNSVSVLTNGHQFRRYALEYTDNGTGYQFVNKVIEYNSNDEPANPVNIEYEPSSTANEEVVRQNDIATNNTKKYGDFNMDGITDYLEYIPNPGNSPNGPVGVIYFKSSLYEDVPVMPLQYELSRFTAAEFAKATPVTFKKNNFVKNQAGIIIPHKVSTSEANKPNYEFLVYSVDLQNSKFNLEYSKVITYDQYVIGAPMDDDLPLPGCNYSQVTLSDITAYDYNGDGISELLFGFKRTRTCINTNPGTGIDYSGKSTSKTATSSSEEGLPYIQPSVNASNTDPGSDNPDVPENDDTTGNITPGSSMTSFYASVLFNLDENVSVDQSIYKYEEGTGTAKKIQLADFNGDGIQDIVLLNTSNGTITRVFNIINNSDGTFDTVNVGAFSGQTLGGISSAALYGDFNGDSKIDVLVPQANKSSNWNLYVSDGNKLNAYYINNFVFYLAGTETISSGVHNTFFESGCTYGVSRYLQYNTADLDGDGKSEIVVSNVLVNDHKWNAHHDQEWTKTHVTVYSVNKLSGALNTAVIYNPSYPSGLSTITLLSNIDNPAAIQTNSSVNFYRTRDWLHTFNEKVIPFSNLTLNRDNQQVILLGRPDDCSGVVGCPYNHVLKYNYPYVPAIARVKFIKQGGITTEIAYKELDSKTDPNFYKPVKPEQFPYFELAKIPLSLAVSQLKQYTTAGTLIQDFRYRGFLSHFTGRGVIGFRQSARSSLYAEGFENSKIWTGTEMDPLMDGVPVKEWSIRTNNENLIFPADISENNSQLLSYKSTNYKTDKLLSGQVVNTVTNIDKPKVVMATVPVSTVTKDFLTNTVTTGTILYDSYYLPSKTTKNINGSFSTTINTFNYIHNPSGIGKDYFIGRLEVEELQHTAYNTTNRETQHYTYQDNLPKTIINAVGNNLSDNLTEEYKYDGFGNITEKKIISGVDSQIRLNKTQYDDKGRFVIKKTDNIGLETNITYNDWGQILTQTDPIGNTLINTYDFWGKVLTSKTNLEGTTTYEYIRDSQKNTIVAEYESDGNISRKFTNILGQEYKTQTKAFEQGKFISVYRVFDALGRKIKESEPYFDQAAEELPANIQWNLFVYDDTVFPAKVTTLFFNGKTTETSISGTVTTVKEINGYGRTTSKTVDALGNVVAATDKGGTINFTYDSRGNQLTAQYGTNVVATKYDVWDRKSEFNDPSNGIYKYEYNGFGQPTKIISPKGIKEYGYNSLGQLITQKELSTVDGGQATNKLISFTYDDKGRMISKAGTSKGKSYSANTFYDSQGRRLSLSESSNGKYFIQKGITYDDKGRVISYEKQLYSSGTLTKVQIENNYSAWNGELYQVKDKVSGKILWELQNTNAKGQVLTAKLGAAGINNTYDANGFLTNVNHSSQVKPSILQISYSFDAIRNELNYRKTEGDFAIEEKFDYDDNNRLINWTDPVTKVKPSAKRNVYDINGRILENDQVGTIKYGNSAKVYQPTGMTLNAAGTQNYNNDLIQSIVYNENNDPVFIDGQKGDVAFQYGLTGMRQRVTYGGNFNADGEGKFTKFYSEDGSYEIQVNNSTGAEKHILYIGGTPYESNIVYVKNYGETTGSFKFLHKDYIGSILAISDEAGNKVEQRHFDAWGNLTHLKIANQSVITDREQINKFIASGGLILDRGYTSHEYFPEVGIIHMNGRLYDPLLRRFLNADENIQDPYNTQNYNKYGYVMNNPLLFNDPSGEYIFGVESALLAAVIIGAIVGAASYVVSAIITGQKFSLVGLFQATVFGAISGAVTFGIGELFAPALQSAVQVSDAALKVMAQSGLALAQATVHGIAQGTLSLMQGGSFHQALLSGALGSLGASAFGAVGKGFANQVTGKVLFGAISGGIGAELSGGNFWQGAVIGGIVAGLNHGLHEMDSTHPSDGDKPKKGKTGKAPSKAKNVQKLVKTASQVATVLDIVGDTPGSRSTLKLIGKPAGKAFPILETTSNVMEYANGDISGQRLTYRTVGVGTSIVVGAEAGSVVPGYGSLIGAVAGGIFGGAELLYDKFNQYVKPVMQQKVNHFNNQIKFSR